MRPEWLACAKCLFLRDGISEGEYECWRSPKPIKKYPGEFCGSWTCRHCLQPWRMVEIEYINPERTNGYEFYSVSNHFQCAVAGEHYDPQRPINQECETP